MCLAASYFSSDDVKSMCLSLWPLSIGKLQFISPNPNRIGHKTLTDAPIKRRKLLLLPEYRTLRYNEVSYQSIVQKLN